MAVVTGAPVGTIALLFTDIEGSTQLAGELGEAWPGVLADHHAIVGGAIAEEAGFVDGTEGDAFFATFADARAAARAAVAAQRRLRSRRWPTAVGELRVRMGLHVGYVERAATGYVGLEVHRAARVAAAAHGGQLLLTGAARAMVSDELVLEPLGAHRLKDFPTPELLYCAVVDDRGAAFFPPPRTEQVRPNNLPAGLATLVGREAELEQIRDAFVEDGDRLVTLTGRGGAGKTSVALAVATSLLDKHPGGVWLVRLASAQSPGDVLPLVAGAVGARSDGDESVHKAIARRLAGRGRTLLVLDNLEHLLAAAESIVGLLEVAPELCVLATSQAPLRVAGERCLNVDALDDDAAVALIERVASRRSASFRVAVEDRAVLAEIASLLDGLPLALELAGARLMVLRPAQLRDRLRSSSDVLRDDARDRSDRHRSLRATVDWTLALVDRPTRELFIRAGAFAGPVELEELELVAGRDGLDVLEALTGLVDVALMRRVESGDGRIRFGLPEALRQIAAAMLDDAPDGEHWRREHARRQLALLWPARAMFVSKPVIEAALAADVEAAAALQWARATGDAVAPALAAARATLLGDKGRILEALAILEPLLGSPPADPQIYGQAMCAYAHALGFLGKHVEAIAAADEAVALLTGNDCRALALITRALMYLQLGQLEPALADNERATALARDLGPDALSTALLFEGQTRIEAGQLDRAAALLEEAKAVCADGHFSVHTFEGDLALQRRQPRQAVHHYALSLLWAQERVNHMQVFNDLVGLADALAMNGDDLEALEVSGMAAAQIEDIGGSAQSAWHIDGRDLTRESEDRLGAAAAAEARRRGREVDAGYRVTRACELALERQQVEP